MNPLKIKLLTELMGHMDSSQGKDLKALKDAEMMEKPEDEALESPEKQAIEDELGIEAHDKPKGVAIEKVSLMAKPKGDELMDMIRNKTGDLGMGEEEVEGGDEEMSDDELKELLSKLM